MKKLLAVLACASALCFGQGANTVFQGMLSNSVTIGVTTVVRNIGQQYHLMSVQPVNIGTGTGCSITAQSWAGVIQLEASFDGASYFLIGVPVRSVQYGQTGVVSASGAYPYVRVNYMAGNISQCALTVRYSGSVTGTLTGSAPYSAYEDTFIPFTGGANTTGAFDVVVCGAGRVSIYSLSLLNAVSTANRIFAEILDPNSMITYDSFSVTLGPYGQLIWPQGSRPYQFAVNAPAGISTVLQFTLGSATQVDFTGSFRCE